MGLKFKRKQRMADRQGFDTLSVLNRFIIAQKEVVEQQRAIENRTGDVLPKTTKEMKVLTDLCYKAAKLEIQLNQSIPNGPFDYGSGADYGDVDFNIPNNGEIAKRTREVLKTSKDPRLKEIIQKICM